MKRKKAKISFVDGDIVDMEDRANAIMTLFRAGQVSRKSVINAIGIDYEEELRILEEERSRFAPPQTTPKRSIFNLLGIDYDEEMRLLMEEQKRINQQ